VVNTISAATEVTTIHSIAYDPLPGELISKAELNHKPGSTNNSWQRLIKHGASTVVVPGVPPLGCLPPNLAFFPSADPAAYDSRTGCLAELNDLAAYHNSLLQEALQSVRTAHPDARVIYADFFSPVIEMVESPDKLGQFFFVSSIMALRLISS
jgi:phospholipase/lecithinase/hemolysin